MPPNPSPYSNLTPLPSSAADLTLMMYRLDQCTAETHQLRKEMQEGFQSIRKDQDLFRQELSNQRLEFNTELNNQRLEFKSELSKLRLEFKTELGDCRAEFKTELVDCRAEFRAEMQSLHEQSRKEFDAWLARSRVDMKEHLASVTATVDDKIKLSGQASDIRLLKWCARAAISSSAAAGSLAYAVSKLMP